MSFTRANLCEALFGRAMSTKELARLYGVEEDEIVRFYGSLKARGLLVLEDPERGLWARAKGAPETIEAFRSHLRDCGLDVSEPLTTRASVSGVRVRPPSQAKRGRARSKPTSSRRR